MTKRRLHASPRRYWSAKDLAHLKRLYLERPTKEVAETLSRGISGVYGMAKKLGLQKSWKFQNSDLSGRLRKGSAQRGERTRFVKGQTPANKGLRRPGYSVGRGRMRETQFKKGERTGAAAKNWKPIGTILTDDEGYLRIKVREYVYGKEPSGTGNTKVWPMYNRYLWEKHHGPIPPSHVVVFKDGDRANCVIENLDLISRADLARRNSMWNNLPRELAEVIQLSGALKRKIRSIHGKQQDQRSA